jgi:hypothetical protein
VNLFGRRRRVRSSCEARGKATDGTPIQQWPRNKITNENWSFGITNNLLSSGVPCDLEPSPGYTWRSGRPCNVVEVLYQHSFHELDPSVRKDGGPKVLGLVAIE